MASAKPLHFETLTSNTKEVLRLVEIHATLTGAGRGRRHNVAILNKSGIVLTVSCWEAFVEDLATFAFEWLLARAESPTVFPRKVLTLASKELRESPDVSRLWELSGIGWRQVMERHKLEVLKRSAAKLNTPRPKQVDELFADLLGVAGLSSSWKWHNVSNGKIKQSLEDLVTLRGEIAHRVVSTKPVKKGDVQNAVELVVRLAVASSNTVRQFLMTRSTDEPWPQYKYSNE